jgi:signal peptidase I
VATEATRTGWAPFLGTIIQLVLWIGLLTLLLLSLLPRLTAYDVFVVRGGSMEPTIAVGSIVIVDRADRSPQIGQIATFADPQAGLVTHRVIGQDGALYVTQGDANSSADVTHRSASDVVGVERLAIPYLGYVLHALQTPVVFLLLLLGTAGFLIFGELRTIATELRRLRGRSEA